MKDIYIRSRDFLSNLNLKALSILRRCQALAVSSMMWLYQFKSQGLEIMIFSSPEPKAPR